MIKIFLKQFINCAKIFTALFVLVVIIAWYLVLVASAIRAAYNGEIHRIYGILAFLSVPAIAAVLTTAEHYWSSRRRKR